MQDKTFQIKFLRVLQWKIPYYLLWEVNLLIIRETQILHVECTAQCPAHTTLLAIIIIVVSLFKNIEGKKPLNNLIKLVAPIRKENIIIL